VDEEEGEDYDRIQENKGGGSIRRNGGKLGRGNWGLRKRFGQRREKSKDPPACTYPF